MARILCWHARRVRDLWLFFRIRVRLWLHLSFYQFHPCNPQFVFIRPAVAGFVVEPKT
jgi:hypothetical protein